MGLFSVTCTGTRAWTPASGPRTLLSARGTNTRVLKSVSCPLHVAKLDFLVVFTGRLRTTGHTVPHTKNLMCKGSAWSYCSHRPCPQPPSILPPPGGTNPRPFCSSGPSLPLQPQTHASFTLSVDHESPPQALAL